MDKAQAGKLVVGAAVAAAVGFGLSVLDPLGRHKLTPAKAEAAAAGDPAFSRYLAAYKESFPAEYQQMLKTVTDNANAGMPQDQARRAGFAQTNMLVTQHRRDLMRAPDAALVTHVRAQHALLAGLDPPQCARIFMNGPSPDEQIAEPALLLVADFTAATMRAERAGMDGPVVRPTALSPADRDALFGTMRRQGMTPAQEQAFVGGTLVGSSAADQCAVGRALTGAIAALPAPQAGRLWSYTLQGG